MYRYKAVLLRTYQVIIPITTTNYTIKKTKTTEKNLTSRYHTEVTSIKYSCIRGRYQHIFYITLILRNITTYFRIHRRTTTIKKKNVAINKIRQLTNPTIKGIQAKIKSKHINILVVYCHCRKILQSKANPI